MCSSLSNGTYVKTSAKCSSSKKFDPNLNVCSDDYACNSNSSTTVGSTVIDFQCTKTGRFEDPNDATCTTYYLCSKYYGTFIKTLYKCPLSTNFDPELHRCTTQHICTTSTAVPTTTTSAPEITTEAEMVSLLTDTTTVAAGFQCVKTGRFENPSDLSCTSYYLCSKYYGTFLKTLYKCPISTFFDPDLHRCTTQHVCTTATTTIAPTTTDFTKITTESEMVSMLNSSSATTTEINYDNFICSSRGRYADWYDNTCKSYYLCNQLHNGTLLRTAYSCPSNSVFDQSIYKCTTLQDCNSIRNSAFVVTPQFDN